MLLLDAHQCVIDPDHRSVGIGLFDNAFERQFNPGPPSHDRVDPILDEAGEARNFVGSDSRRFYVRLRDASPADAGTLPDGRRFVVARWYTRDERAEVLDANRGASEITLVETRAGEFQSMALMLVSSESDRDLCPHCGILGRYSRGSEYRGHGDTDHRLRLATLSGDMVFAYPSKSAVPVQTVVAHPFLPAERRRLPLCLFVGSTSGADRPVAQPDEVFDASLGRAARIYASIGIGVETAEHPVAEELIRKGDRRVRKLRGGPAQRDFFYVVDGPALFGRRTDLGEFSTRDFHAFCRAFPDAGRVVRVLYVAAFDDGKFGMACPETDFANRVEAGACACQRERYPDRAIMAHEVGHLLTDKSSRYGTIADQTNGFPQFGGHFSRPAHPPDNRFVHFYNLMGGSRYRLWDVDVTDAPPGAEPKTFNQYRDVRASRYVR
jgi:hypothetical protein